MPINQLPEATYEDVVTSRLEITVEDDGMKGYAFNTKKKPKKAKKAKKNKNKFNPGYM